MDTQTFIREIVALANEQSGPKDGQVFVDQANEVLKEALLASKISKSDILALIQAFKDLPLDSAEEAQIVYDQGIAKQAEEKNPILLEQFKASAPAQARKEKLSNVKRLSDILLAIAFEKGYDNRCLSWGSIARTEIFEGVGKQLIPSMVKYAYPKAREQLQGKFIFNVMTLEVAYSIVETHWHSIFTFRDSFKELGLAKAGSKLGDKISSVPFYTLSLDQVKQVQADIKSQNDEEALGVGSTPLKRYTKGKFALLLYCSVAIDVRVLLQCSDFRQRKSKTPAADDFKAMKVKIKDLMMKVITSANNTYSGEFDLNSKTPFTKMYYTSLATMRTSVRHWNVQCNGGNKGGKDTRSGALKVE